MKLSNSRASIVIMMVLMIGVLGGCQDRLKQERDALWSQNQELQAELDRKAAELRMAQSEISVRNAEIDRVRNEMAAAPIVTNPAPLSTGFSSIPGVETRVGPGAITVRVPGDVLFASGKVQLKNSAQETLNQIGDVIEREYPTESVRIEGYTDTDPIRRSRWKDNLDLSLARAAAVHRYLAKNGISPKRMYAAGFGEHRPRSSKAQSRRVEIVVVLDQ